MHNSRARRSFFVCGCVMAEQCAVTLEAVPEDVLICIFDQLPPCSLRAAATSNKAWCSALRRSPESIRRRASWLHHWTTAGGASIRHVDPAVCTGDGTWHPGGVALSATLHLSRRPPDTGFRLIVEDASAGCLHGTFFLYPVEALQLLDRRRVTFDAERPLLSTLAQ